MSKFSSFLLGAFLSYIGCVLMYSIGLSKAESKRVTGRKQRFDSEKLQRDMKSRIAISLNKAQRQLALIEKGA